MVLVALLAALQAQATPLSVPEPEAALPLAPAPAPLNVVQWLNRLHNATRSQSYVGTLVVLSSSGAMSSSRIWHACAGEQQIDRIEALTGTPRITYRLDSEVRTFWPQTHTVRQEPPAVAGAFAHWPAVDGSAVANFYTAVPAGSERVAGLVADVVWFKPQDQLRFGYRIWSERRSGLVIKMQTLHPDGRVLEQVGFSELDLGASVQPRQLLQMMQDTKGYRLVRVPVQATTQAEQGWRLRQPVAGFVSTQCYMHAEAANAEAVPAPSASVGTVAAAESGSTVQCIYSDGLATVSLFIDPAGTARRPLHPRASGQWSMGATHLLAQPVGAHGWVTAVGEVPPRTLALFVRNLERVR